MTIQTAIKNHVTDKKMRMRISESFLRRGIDVMTVEDFAKKYNRFSILQFHNVGKETAGVIMEVVKKVLN